MPIYHLTHALVFPPPELADPDGIVAIGGDLRPERLRLAYAQGIFPWPHRGYPLLWFSPDPRMVLRACELHVGRRLERVIRQRRFEVRLDTAFGEVMRRCAAIRRAGQRGTWITPAMIEGYTALHTLGYAHSAEAWLDGRLVGGVYGVSIGRVFTGESMFTTVPNASKVAFATLVRQLDRWGIDLVDAQVHTPHVEAFGATLWPRERFLAALRDAADEPERYPTRLGPWRLDPEPTRGVAMMAQ
jgi:leucyl/phenylalanyl-tRNA--protein transferase